ncbi:MAG: sulfotransferase [Pseudomonadales bacterium]
MADLTEESGAAPSAVLREAQSKLALGEFSAALQLLDEVLASTPADVDALYLTAVTHRYAGDSDKALEVLARLKRLAPTHSRAHQEEGHVNRDRGAWQEALVAYSRAIRLNPALEASLRELVQILTNHGRTQAAQYYATQLQYLQKLPSPVRVAMDLVAQNKLLKAETVCRQYLREQPDDVEGMRQLADIGVKLGVLEEAEFLLESAATFAPDNLAIQLDYVQVLRKRQKFAAALDQAQRLLGVHPQNLQVKSVCAIEYMQTGDYEQAMALLDEVLAEVPDDAATLVTYGHALKTSGKADQAVQKYRRAIERQPDHGESYYALANLKTYRFGDAELERMLSLDATGNLGLMDRVYLNFALAKAYEDRADYATAFKFYALGNGFKKAQSRYDADQMQQEMQATQAVCSADFFAARSGFGVSARDPIFVVGLPRAGSTLLEQVLASHSQVDGTLELPNVLSLAQRLRRRRGGGGYPHVLEQLSARECAELGQAYLDDTRIHRAGAPLFVDKMPNNFRHIGLIHLMLPNARIIDARREPMACCFSGFKQLFAEGQEFSYDLTDIGRYYRDYVELMAHWDDVLPGRVLRVRHEDVVADLETEVRRILDYCGLPFEEACLRYYETDRNVRTPSSEQVRQPIFTDSLEQWRQFEPWLEPLAAALEGLYE